jgi:transcriptional regulator with XRE-family HTH domain
MSGLKERLSQLIAERYAGKVNSAARTWDVPQPTLRRVVSGETGQPRADLLARIADKEGTSVEWLLSGKGAPPPSSLSLPGMEAPITAGNIRWNATLERLNLEKDLSEALSEIVYAPGVASWVCDPALRRDRRKQEIRDAEFEAIRRSADAWAISLDGAIAVFGVKEVARSISHFPKVALLGFSPFALWLELTQNTPPQVAELHTKYLADRAKGFPLLVKRRAVNENESRRKNVTRKEVKPSRAGQE